MKHYADNLGSNVAAMIKVRQVVYGVLVERTPHCTFQLVLSQMCAILSSL